MISEYADRTNGAFARRLDNAVAFNYANSDPEFGAMQAIRRGIRRRIALGNSSPS